MIRSYDHHMMSYDDSWRFQWLPDDPWWPLMTRCTSQMIPDDSWRFHDDSWMIPQDPRWSYEDLMMTPEIPWWFLDNFWSLSDGSCWLLLILWWPYDDSWWVHDHGCAPSHHHPQYKFEVWFVETNYVVCVSFHFQKVKFVLTQIWSSKIRTIQKVRILLIL